MTELAFALLGSLATLVVKWGFDLVTESIREKRERRKIIFQRKAEAAERAMGAYIEYYNNCSCMKEAVSKITPDMSPVNISLIEDAIEKDRIFKERLLEGLNSVQLYYDFSEIVEQYKMNELSNTIASLGEVICKTNVDISTARQRGMTNEQLAPTYRQLCDEYHLYAQALDAYMKGMSAILGMLRDDYKEYLK